jgi:hypothetical protein
MDVTTASPEFPVDALADPLPLLVAPFPQGNGNMPSISPRCQ